MSHSQKRTHDVKYVSHSQKRTHSVGYGRHSQTTVHVGGRGSQADEDHGGVDVDEALQQLKHALVDVVGVETSQSPTVVFTQVLRLLPAEYLLLQQLARQA